jgi:hypothetical protein
MTRISHTLKSQMIQPAGVHFAITQDTTDEHWPFAFEVDAEEVERFRTQSAAQAKWDSELEEMKSSGSAF